MSSSDVRAATVEGAAAERRRSARIPVTAPVTFRTADTVYEGYTEDVSAFGALVHSFDGLPGRGEEGRVLIELACGNVEAVGRVVRRVPERQEFALDLVQITEGAQYLLAVLMLMPEPALD